ncbi:hypothetical protein A2U01_0092607, partial [Trifolium medium]|nr:hypothetical protein [Trifolium medium]
SQVRTISLKKTFIPHLTDLSVGVSTGAQPPFASTGALSEQRRTRSLFWSSEISGAVCGKL